MFPIQEEEEFKHKHHITCQESMLYTLHFARYLLCFSIALFLQSGKDQFIRFTTKIK